MSKLVNILNIALILGLILLSQNGCVLLAVGAAAGGTAAGVAYATGDLETTLEAPPEQVADATEKAFQDLDITVASKESSNLEAKVTGLTSGHAKMTVVAKSESEKLSKVSIRTGTFGNDSMQARVLERIRANLGLESTTQPTENVASSR